MFARLLALDFWPRRFDGSLDTAAAVKHLTSELIGRFCGAAEAATRPPGTPPLTRYAASLIVPRRQRLECALLKAVTAHYVMSRPGAAAQQAQERDVITGLAAAVLAGAPGTLDPAYAEAFAAAGSDEARQRAVIDQVASLTDTSARAWHERLCGAGH